MKKLFLMLLLLLNGNMVFSLTLQKVIPDQSLYGGVNIQDNINDLIYKLLSPHLKSSLYPNGLNASGVQSIITGLKRLDVKDIEFFNNDSWNILVKVNSPHFKEISQLFSNLLDGEGFMAKTQKVDANNITIISKNPDLAGNTFFIKKEKQYILITSNQAALSAWANRNTPFTLYDKASVAIKKRNVFGFLYGIDSFYSNSTPTFMTVESNNSADFLNISFIKKMEKPNVMFPRFLKDNPIFFFTSIEDMDTQKSTQIKNFLAPSLIFLPSLRVPMNILLAPNSGVKRMAIEFKDGDLVNINEKKYDVLDMALTFKFASRQIAENLLNSQLKTNKAFDFKEEGSKNQKMFILTPKVPTATARSMGLFPVYFVVNNNGFLAMSMNKKTILEIASNMASNKQNLMLNNSPDASILFVDTVKLIDRFPILNSLVSQFGIDFKTIKTINAPNEFTQLDKEYFKNNINIVLNTIS